MSTGDQISHADVRIAVARANTEIEDEYLKLEAEVERLQEWKGQFDCCMCGSLMTGHDIGSGHSPVSMYDYHLGQMQEEVASAKQVIARLTAEIDSRREDALDTEAKVERLRELLGWAMTCVPFPSDCHTAISNTLKEKA